MDQLTMLWEYQVEDIKADNLAQEIRRSPLRQKMEKDRDLSWSARSSISRLRSRLPC